MYIVELTGRYFKALGVGCLLHNETMRMPYLFNTVGDAVDYIKSTYNVSIYLNKVRPIMEITMWCMSIGSQIAMMYLRKLTLSHVNYILGRANINGMDTTLELSR